MSPGSDQLHLAVALDGTGWHPGSWRLPDARPADVLGPGARLRGRLDAVLIAARAAPRTNKIGLISTVTAAEELVPEVQSNEALRDAYAAGTPRGNVDLPRPANRRTTVS